MNVFYKHYKTDGLYTLVAGDVANESNLAERVHVYRDALNNGDIYYRPSAEFNAAIGGKPRFEAITDATQLTEGMLENIYRVAAQSVSTALAYVYEHGMSTFDSFVQVTETDVVKLLQGVIDTQKTHSIGIRVVGLTDPNGGGPGVHYHIALESHEYIDLSYHFLGAEVISEISVDLCQATIRHTKLHAGKYGVAHDLVAWMMGTHDVEGAYDDTPRVYVDGEYQAKRHTVNRCIKDCGTVTHISGVFFPHDLLGAVDNHVEVIFPEVDNQPRVAFIKPVGRVKWYRVEGNDHSG